MPALTPGDRFAGYRIDRLLGEQEGAGLVYEATHLLGGRFVALKVVEVAGGEEASEPFVTAARAQSDVRSPHVVDVYEAGHADGRFFMAMELVRGRTLRALLSDGPLPPQRTLVLLGGLARGLEAVHTAGLVHRNLKPETILIDVLRRDHVMLGDLGAVVSDVQPPAEALQYLSPEQVAGEPPGRLSNVYTLGALAFECLTGSVPFPRSRDRATIVWNLEAPRPRVTELRNELPPAIDEVIARAMATSPGDRQESPQAFVEATARALGVETSAAPPPAAAPKATAGRTADTAPRQTPERSGPIWSRRGPAPARPRPDEAAAASAAAAAAAAAAKQARATPPPPAGRPAPEAPPSAPPADRPAPRKTPEAAPTPAAADTAPSAPRPEATAPAAPPAARSKPPAPEAPPSKAPAPPARRTDPGDTREVPTDGTAPAARPQETREAPARGRDARPAPAPPRREERRPAAREPERRPAPARKPARRPAAPPVAEPPRRRRKRPGFLFAALVLAVGAAVVGFALAGNFGEDGASSTASTGDLQLAVPNGWGRRTDPPALPGLELDSPFALSPKNDRSITLTAGGIDAKAVPDFLDRLDPSPRSGEVVEVGGLQARRYRAASPEGFEGPVTIYLLPSTEGPSAVACLGEGAAAASGIGRCENASAAIALVRGESAPATPTADEFKSLQSSFDVLNGARRRNLAKLARAGTRTGQAYFAARLRDAYGDTADTVGKVELTSLAEPSGADAVAALEAGQAAYADLSTAASRGDEAGFADARRAVTTADAELQKALDGLLTVGYGRA